MFNLFKRNPWKPIDTLPNTGEQVLYWSKAAISVAPALKLKTMIDLSKEERKSLYELTGRLGGDLDLEPKYWMSLDDLPKPPEDR